MIFASSRLIARRFGLDDLADFVAMRNDPEVARYQSWERYSEDDGRRFIAELSGLEPGDPGWFQFALEERQTGIFVGDCGLNILADDAVYARLRD
jgi:RimJ/RimL family protein N-acetyltransferase